VLRQRVGLPDEFARAAVGLSLLVGGDVVINGQVELDVADPAPGIHVVQPGPPDVHIRHAGGPVDGEIVGDEYVLTRLPVRPRPAGRGQHDGSHSDCDEAPGHHGSTSSIDVVPRTPASWRSRRRHVRGPARAQRSAHDARHPCDCGEHGPMGPRRRRAGQGGCERAGLALSLDLQKTPPLPLAGIEALISLPRIPDLSRAFGYGSWVGRRSAQRALERRNRTAERGGDAEVEGEAFSGFA